MSITKKCTRKGCERKFTHPTENQAAQALRMHVGRVHKKHIKPRHNHGGRRKKQDRAVIVAQPQTLEIVPSDRRTRAYREGMQARFVEESSRADASLNFCPRCATSLTVVRSVMNGELNACPTCAYPLKTLRVAHVVALRTVHVKV
jgi:hypothetical protein